MWNCRECCFRRSGWNRKWPACSRLQWIEMILVLAGLLHPFIMIFKVILAGGLATLLFFLTFLVLLQLMISASWGILLSSFRVTLRQNPVLDIIYKLKSCIIMVFNKGFRNFLANWDSVIMHMHCRFNKLHMICLK